MLKKKVLSAMSVAVIGVSLFGGVIASAAETASETVTATFTQPETIELTLSTNTVDFGGITGFDKAVTHTPSDLVVKVKSSLAYDLSMTATDNFKNSTNVSATPIPVTKLGVSVDAGAITKFPAVGTPVILVSNASDTSAEVNAERSHIVKFDLDSTVGYKAGVYSAPLTVVAIQK